MVTSVLSYSHGYTARDVTFGSTSISFVVLKALVGDNSFSNEHTVQVARGYLLDYIE